MDSIGQQQPVCNNLIHPTTIRQLESIIRIDHQQWTKASRSNKPLGIGIFQSISPNFCFVKSQSDKHAALLAAGDGREEPIEPEAAPVEISE